MILNNELEYDVLYDRAIKYRDLYNNSPDIHMSVNSSTANIVECNLTACKKLEYKKEELIGKPIFSLIQEENLPSAIKAFKNFKTTGRVENVEIIMVSKSGKLIYLLLNTEAIRDKEGNILYSNSCLRDISKIKLLEKELETSNQLLEKRVLQRTKELENKNKELEQFAYIASHDLKEPLNTIVGFSELLISNNQKDISENNLMYINYILDSSKRMTNLVDDILNYSKLDQLKNIEPVNCNDIINSIVNDLSSTISYNKAQINFCNLPLLKGYKTGIRLLFQNLISNSLKFKKDNDAPIINITHTDHQNYYEFCVEDNGIGISKKNQKNIFEIFNRVHSNNNIKGTGIGLAHCKKIIQLHKGKIWVESKEGVGSKFYFTINKF